MKYNTNYIYLGLGANLRSLSYNNISKLIENEYKDMQEENRKLKRINKQAEKYLGNLNKNIMTVTEDQKGSAEMQQQLDKTKQ